MSHEQMIDAFENQFCACWDDPAMQDERTVWALAWAAATAQPAPCDMGDLCIGCTPRISGVCPGAAQPTDDQIISAARGQA